EEKDLKAYHQTASELLQEHDSISVVAAALKLMTKERRDVPVRISSVAPVSVKKAQRSDNKRRSNNNRFYGKRNQGGGRNPQGGRNRKWNFQRRRKQD